MRMCLHCGIYLLLTLTSLASAAAASASETGGTEAPRGEEYPAEATAGPFLLLNGNRFVVTANWHTPDGAFGRGQGTSLSDDTGLFWFFDPANAEVLVKVLNACPFGNRFWFFAGGLTNVEVQLNVTDTATGLSKTYKNPQGTAFQPIQDTNAFAVCDDDEELCEENPDGKSAGAGNTSEFVVCVPKEENYTDERCREEFEDELLQKARDRALYVCTEHHEVTCTKKECPNACVNDATLVFNQGVFADTDPTCDETQDSCELGNTIWDCDCLCPLSP